MTDMLPGYILLSDMGNMNKRDNNLVRGALEMLGSRLPSGWKSDIGLASGSRDVLEANTRLRVRGPDGKASSLAVHARRSLTPRGVLDLRSRLGDDSASRTDLVVAPYLGLEARTRLAECGIHYVDLTGNVRISLASPGLFIDAHGADVDPDRQARSSRSLRGGKAGRIVRTLVDRKDPPGVRELAGIAGMDPGYVSRVLAVLDRQALIERGRRGRISSVDWPRLLARWSEESPLESRGPRSMCLAPRGIEALVDRLKGFERRHAVTGTLAVSEFAPVAAARLAVIYVDGFDDAVPGLDLRIAERGANVMLIEPSDDWVFEGSSVRRGVHVVSVSQAAADLLTSPGRGPAEAEALIAWMRENEGEWRV